MRSKRRSEDGIYLVMWKQYFARGKKQEEKWETSRITALSICENSYTL
jgi:hypothetical protein